MSDTSTTTVRVEHYPRDVVDAAPTATHGLPQAVTARERAFAGVHREWLEKAAALGGGS
ncbi:hypothetical protein KDK95_17730 [Actinospica sp. MGRD01-02]|uniref:Uncharacterized protein n=1 Tax=Actinospica acidithermotolerans TaxID=2828514 RepID=A0A941IJR6_9ACTN|nr:hypothetical protein [Actinospica acidithermotolerans]MBR7828162.1 hypothetical protein [Actinospica acidithermotolerans]